MSLAIEDKRNPRGEVLRNQAFYGEFVANIKPPFVELNRIPANVELNQPRVDDLCSHIVSISGAIEKLFIDCDAQGFDIGDQKEYLKEVRELVEDSLFSRGIRVNIENKIFPLENLKVGEYFLVRGYLLRQIKNPLQANAQYESQVLYRALRQTAAGKISIGVSDKHPGEEHLFSADIKGLLTSHQELKNPDKGPLQLSQPTIQRIQKSLSNEGFDSVEDLVSNLNIYANRLRSTDGNPTDSLDTDELTEIDTYQKHLIPLLKKMPASIADSAMKTEVRKLSELAQEVVQKAEVLTGDDPKEGLDIEFDGWKRKLRMKILVSGGRDFEEFINQILSNPHGAGPNPIPELHAIITRLDTQEAEETSYLDYQSQTHVRKYAFFRQRQSRYLQKWKALARRAIDELTAAGVVAPAAQEVKLSESEEAFRTFCTFIRENVDKTLPELDYKRETFDATDKIFLEQYERALFILLIDRCLSPMVTSSNTDYPTPGGKVEALDVNITGSQEGIKGTVQNFIDNLPPRFTLAIKERLRFRFLAITNYSNRAHAFTSKPDTWWKNYAAPIEQFGGGDGAFNNAGGYTNWDLDPLYLTRFSGGAERDLWGNRDDFWQLGAFTTFFINIHQSALKNPSEVYSPLKIYSTRLGALKRKAMGMIPDRYKNDPRFAEQLEIAWLMACWNAFSSLKINEADSGALQGQNISRAMNNRIYARKVTLGVANAGERQRPSNARIIEKAGVNQDARLHVLIELPRNGYEQVEFDQLDTATKKELLTLYGANLKGVADISKATDAELILIYQAHRANIDSRIAILRVKKEHQVFGHETQDAVGKVVVIPKTWILENWISPGNDLIQISLEQMYDLVLDGDRVLWNSITPAHNSAYAREQKLMNRWSLGEYGQAYDTAAVFVPIHDPAIQQKIGKKVDLGINPFKEIMEQYEQFISGLIQEDVQRALDLDKRMRENVHITEVPIDDVVVGEAPAGGGKITIGLGTADIVQYMARYFGDEAANMGAKVPERGNINVFGSLRMRDIHIFETMFRTDRDDERERVTPLPLRRAIDMYDDAARVLLDDPENREAKRQQRIAQNTAIVVAFYYAACMYLDQYMYDRKRKFRRTLTGGDGALAYDYDQVRELLVFQKKGDQKPMAFDDREAFLAYMTAQVNAFITPRISFPPGEQPIWWPTTDHFLKAMQDRGIIGTSQQEVADWYTFRKDENKYFDSNFYKQKAVVEKEEKKKEK